MVFGIDDGYPAPPRISKKKLREVARQVKQMAKAMRKKREQIALEVLK